MKECNEETSKVTRKMSGELAEPTLDEGLDCHAALAMTIPKYDNANGELSKVYYRSVSTLAEYISKLGTMESCYVKQMIQKNTAQNTYVFKELFDVQKINTEISDSIRLQHYHAQFFATCMKFYDGLVDKHNAQNSKQHINILCNILKSSIMQFGIICSAVNYFLVMKEDSNDISILSSIKLITLPIVSSALVFFTYCKYLDFTYFTSYMDHAQSHETINRHALLTTYLLKKNINNMEFEDISQNAINDANIFDKAIHVLSSDEFNTQCTASWREFENQENAEEYLLGDNHSSV
jgi:hypothetical protein